MVKTLTVFIKWNADEEQWEARNYSNAFCFHGSDRDECIHAARGAMLHCLAEANRVPDKIEFELVEE